MRRPRFGLTLPRYAQSMKLSQQDIEEFIEAYRTDFGETISMAEAEEMATRVLAVFRLLATDPCPRKGEVAP